MAWKTYDELTMAERCELAADYLCKLADEGTFRDVTGADYDAPSYSDIANAIEIVPSDVLEREYSGAIFFDDDFWR